MSATKIDRRSASPDVDAHRSAAVADPAVKAWTRRLRKVLANMPANVGIHVYENTVSVQARAGDGGSLDVVDGCADNRATVDTIDVPRLSAGEW